MKAALLRRRGRRGGGGGVLGALNGLPPFLLAQFGSDTYRKEGAAVPYGTLFASTATGNATLVDSTGKLVWRSHNLVLQSATPATQSITVVVGASYTVECAGSGSVTLSGAGAGAASDGTPRTITATTTTLTLTVSGSLSRMWAYRSDIGGMAPVPVADRVAGSLTYVPTTTAARYLPRRNHREYIGGQWANVGALHESEARTNLLHTTNALVTQSRTVTAVPHTLHFTGTGTVTLSGAATGALVGTGTGEQNRVRLTFTPTAVTLTLTVSGTVANAQLEVGSTGTSYIPNLSGSGTVTRAAESLQIPAIVLTKANGDNILDPVPTGSELVTNGGFDTDLSAWLTGGSIWEDGKIRCTNGAFGQTVFSGPRLVEISWDATINSGTRYRPRFRDASDSVDYLFQYFTGSGPQKVACWAPNGLRVIFLVEATDNVSFDNISVREIEPRSITFVMKGRLNYADRNSIVEARMLLRQLDSNNRISVDLATNPGTGRVNVFQAVTGTSAGIGSGESVLSPGASVPFAFAATFSDDDVRAAVNGVSLAPTLAPNIMPDLRATILELLSTFNGTIEDFRIYAGDPGDEAREEITA